MYSSRNKSVQKYHYKNDIQLYGSFLSQKRKIGFLKEAHVANMHFALNVMFSCFCIEYDEKCVIDNIQGAPKKMHHSDLYTISVLEVEFYFFTCVLNLEF